MKTHPSFFSEINAITLSLKTYSTVKNAFSKKTPLSAHFCKHPPFFSSRLKSVNMFLNDGGNLLPTGFLNSSLRICFHSGSFKKFSILKSPPASVTGSSIFGTLWMGVDFVSSGLKQSFPCLNLLCFCIDEWTNSCTDLIEFSVFGLNIFFNCCSREINVKLSKMAYNHGHSQKQQIRNLKTYLISLKRYRQIVKKHILKRIIPQNTQTYSLVPHKPKKNLGTCNKHYLAHFNVALWLETFTSALDVTLTPTDDEIQKSLSQQKLKLNKGSEEDSGKDLRRYFFQNLRNPL
ncbi:hypothetical protein BpHYR1_005148 [Brachionus plicatilis]|uniref:Uncharacterized protein n=1 Tax=Brachionus plicatilis TaxID=10195 RepID=A0A3M7SPH5_BRAPC|nr:hypothetical protein BpHYR1_005148 [Brachionus plicatilis]